MYDMHDMMYDVWYDVWCIIMMVWNLFAPEIYGSSETLLESSTTPNDGDDNDDDDVCLLWVENNQ